MMESPASGKAPEYDGRDVCRNRRPRKERQMNRRWLALMGALVVVALLVGGCQNQPTAEEIVARMREVEASTEDVHGVLEVGVHDVGKDEQVVVEVWEKKPDKTRVETLESSDPDLAGAVIVGDGQQVWMYSPAENRVLVSEVGADEPSSPRDLIRFMEQIIQRMLDASEMKLLGEEDVAGVPTYKLELTPKEGEDAILPVDAKVTLWVDQERWVVLRAHMISDLLGEASMRVRSFELNTGLGDDLFQFEVPEGAEVASVESRQPVPLTLDEARAEAAFLLVPSYVPEGATLISVFSVDDAYVLHYDHSTTSFTIMQGWSPAEGEIPQGQTTEVTLRGQTATLITDASLGNSFLTWVEDGVTITIAGRISEDEILEVAESLQ
jgi:outer membrane lipoprotein-sorting protein